MSPNFWKGFRYASALSLVFWLALWGIVVFGLSGCPMGSQQAVYDDPFLTIQPDVYGPGIGMDQAGRPVQVVPY